MNGGYILKVLVCLGVMVGYTWGYSGGDGSADHPYLISSEGELLGLANQTLDYDKHFKLTNDLDLQGYPFTGSVIGIDGNASSGGYDGVEFSGRFDGDGHVIRNLRIHNTNEDFMGLFGWISGEVLNLRVEDVSMHGDYCIGGLCGWNGGVVRNCYVSGTVQGEGRAVGGLSGRCNGSYYNCGMEGSLSGAYDVGGIVGDDTGSVISGCWSNCEIYSEGTRAGGIVGSNFSCTIEYCCALGSIVSGSSFIGGICGDNSFGTIQNCYATIAVEGTEYYMGGICGYDYGDISNCYSTGRVTAPVENSGGLCGLISTDNSVVSNCFWDIQSSGFTAGYSPASTGVVDNVIGLSSDAMKEADEYIDGGWDFMTVWSMPQEDGTPILYWQKDIVGDIYGGYGVDLDDVVGLSLEWMSVEAGRGDLTGDGVVNLADFAVMAMNWLEGS